ncbi:MAG: IS30 family transposase, partial [Mycoplasmatales bacterium]
MMYNHLNLEQRNIIAYMRNIENRTIQYIANSIGVHKSTVSREIKRNSIVQRDTYWNYNTFYIPQVAVDLYLTRRAKKAKEKLTREYINIIKRHLKKDYSPEQISGFERMLNKNFPSFRTIYNYIYDNEIKIPKRYRLKLKKRSQAKNSPVKNKELFCHSVHERPEKINSRRHFGCWELDLVESAGNGGYLISFVERVTDFTITQYIPTKKAKHVNEFIKKIIKSNKVKSITTDNGSEFHQLYIFTIRNKIQIYYTDPGAPHQKGLVEYTNKLIREYIFKNKVFDNNIIRPLKVYTKIINSRPKKRNNFL